MSATAGRAAAPAIAEWQALGTSAVLAVADAGVLGHARAIVEHELDGIDRACSRFREDSDLSRANARGGRFVEVQPLLIEAVEVALRAARLTDGDVDPTIGVALELAGYDRDWSLIEKDQAQAPGAAGPERSDPTARCVSCAPPRVRARTRPGWQAVEIDRASRAIRVPRGVKLDLGATAKALAADRASRAVRDALGRGALVSLGGDISIAGAAPAGGWHVHVTDDHRAGPSAPGQRIVIGSGGLATSSVMARRWLRDGREMHHIIDPSSAMPASGPWRTASVAAASCVDANIASTAALLRGESAPAWLSDLGLPARLVSRDGEVLAIGSWPREAGEVLDNPALGTTRLDDARPTACAAALA
jgi:FAD:protein FMN transferase